MHDGFGYVPDDENDKSLFGHKFGPVRNLKNLPDKVDNSHLCGPVQDCTKLPGMASTIAVMNMSEEHNKRNLKGSEYIAMPRILMSGIKDVFENNIGNHLNECRCKLCKYYYMLSAFGIFSEDYEPPVLE